MEPSKLQIFVTLLMVYAFIFGLSFLSTFMTMRALFFNFQDLTAAIFYHVYALILICITVYFFYTFIVSPIAKNFYESQLRKERIKAL